MLFHAQRINNGRAFGTPIEFDAEDSNDAYDIAQDGVDVLKQSFVTGNKHGIWVEVKKVKVRGGGVIKDMGVYIV